MTERDLEALRAGITEQVEAEVRRKMWLEEYERERVKPSVKRVVVIPADQLMVGDVVCSTSGYRVFKAELTVQDIQRKSSPEFGLRVGTLWISYDHGGSALAWSDPVLVQVPRPLTEYPFF